MNKAEKYRCRHVKLTGMFQRDKELRKYFGVIDTAVLLMPCPLL